MDLVETEKAEPILALQAAVKVSLCFIFTRLLMKSEHFGKPHYTVLITDRTDLDSINYQQQFANAEKFYVGDNGMWKV